MGALNQNNRFMLNLAISCARLLSFLSKSTECKWEEEQETAFQKIKRAIQKITGTKHFKRNQPVRIICDASKEGLRAVHQQESEEGWVATHFASRFLTTFEQKYSISGLELLAVVWAIDNFRNYVYGKQFEIISDHKAPTNILSETGQIKLTPVVLQGGLIDFYHFSLQQHTHLEGQSGWQTSCPDIHRPAIKITK